MNAKSIPVPKRVLSTRMYAPKTQKKARLIKILGEYRWCDILDFSSDGQTVTVHVHEDILEPGMHPTQRVRITSLRRLDREEVLRQEKLRKAAKVPA